jgi:hypothetical protein
MRYFVGDVVKMRKVHPCGGTDWEVMRVGMDFRIRCLTCDRVVMLPRPKFERAVKLVVKSAQPQALTDSADEM